MGGYVYVCICVLRVSSSSYGYPCIFYAKSSVLQYSATKLRPTLCTLPLHRSPLPYSCNGGVKMIADNAPLHAVMACNQLQQQQQ